MKSDIRYFANEDEASPPEGHTRVLKRDRRGPVRGARPGYDVCDADVEDGVDDDLEHACIADAAAQSNPFPLNVLPNSGDFSHNFWFSIAINLRVQVMVGMQDTHARAINFLKIKPY